MKKTVIYTTLAALLLIAAITFIAQAGTTGSTELERITAAVTAEQWPGTQEDKIESSSIAETSIDPDPEMVTEPSVSESTAETMVLCSRSISARRAATTPRRNLSATGSPQTPAH